MTTWFGSRGLRKAFVVVVALSMLQGVPVAAQEVEEAGTGELVGTETEPIGVSDETFVGIPCGFLATRTVMHMQGVGTFHGRTAEGQPVIYEAQIGAGETVHADGPLVVEIENTEDYYHGPFGTHGTVDHPNTPPQGNCADDWVPIPAEVRVFAAGHVHQAGAPNTPCTGVGTFARGGMEDEANMTAEWVLGPDCVVVGNVEGFEGTGTVPADNQYDTAGVHEPCFEHPCPENIQLDYIQLLPPVDVVDPVADLSLTGPTEAEVGDDVTVTATVTEDGSPVLGVDVEFSVAPPGPASPATQTVATGANGEASFTFTVDEEGPYTVTASATHAGQALSDTHTVTFTDEPVEPEPGLTLTGPATATVGETATVVATVTENGTPVQGVEVNFSVAPPGPADPETGTATTGADGQASFAFTATAAGSYTVTAAATHDGQALSGTHVVQFTDVTVPVEPQLTLTGPETATVGETVTVTATVTDDGAPVQGADVSFSVAPGGPADPETGTAMTGANGQASFSFTATATGSYTVTASTVHDGQTLSDTHTVAFTDDPVTPPPPAPGAVCVDLRVSDRLVVGQVCVTNTVDNLLVNYTTTGNWKLRASRLHVADDAADIPRDRRGNADPRRFAHLQPLNRPPVTSFTHTIPLADLDATAGDQLVVAAQADVQRRARRGWKRTQTVSAWGEGTPFATEGVQASNHRARGHRGSFFTYTVQDTTGMTCVDLVAGGRQTAGEVCASGAAGNLEVAYHATGEWLLRATRLHVADDAADVPRDRRGHPRARDFDHWSMHRPPVWTFAHTIPLADLDATAGDELVVAAQADVQHPTARGWMRTVSAWGDGEPFDTDHDHPPTFRLRYTYFTHTVR